MTSPTKAGKHGYHETTISHSRISPDSHNYFRPSVTFFLLFVSGFLDENLA